MEQNLHIQVLNDDELSAELRTELLLETMKSKEIRIISETPIDRNVPIPFEVIIALGSAGAFTALYQIICKVIGKNEAREVVIEKDGVKISIKGHSLPEQKELLDKLLPQLETKRIIIPGD